MNFIASQSHEDDQHDHRDNDPGDNDPGDDDPEEESMTEQYKQIQKHFFLDIQGPKKPNILNHRHRQNMLTLAKMVQRQIVPHIGNQW